MADHGRGLREKEVGMYLIFDAFEASVKVTSLVSAFASAVHVNLNKMLLLRDVNLVQTPRFSRELADKG